MKYNQRTAILNRMNRAGIPFSLAQSGNKKKHYVEVKQIVIQLLYFVEGLTQAEIADLLNTTQATVSRSMASFAAILKSENYPDFLKKYNDWKLKYKAAKHHDDQ